MFDSDEGTLSDTFQGVNEIQPIPYRTCLTVPELNNELLLKTIEFNHYLDSLKNGNIKAICDVARCLLWGIGVEKNVKQGVALLKNVVENKMPEAVLLLAEFLFQAEREVFAGVFDNLEIKYNQHIFLAFFYYCGLAESNDEAKIKLAVFIGCGLVGAPNIALATDIIKNINSKKAQELVQILNSPSCLQLFMNKLESKKITDERGFEPVAMHRIVYNELWVPRSMDTWPSIRAYILKQIKPLYRYGLQRQTEHLLQKAEQCYAQRLMEDACY